jgi:ribose transport system ATP-binding protein
MGANALMIRNLSKTFSGQVVLDRVDLDVAEGEVHALVGQNGSGKSTLIKILAGYHRPDPGASASVRGTPLPLGSASAAHAAAIRFVHQDLGLVLELSGLENLMLGRPYPRGFAGRIRWRDAHRIGAGLLARVGLDIDLRRPVGELGLADRTGLAIARALPDARADGGPDGQAEGGPDGGAPDGAAGGAVLVLDEPTASLPADDVDRLLEIIRRLRAAGHSILIVSHHLDEILEIADRVTVLRDGRMVASRAAAGIDTNGLSSLIIGHDLVISAGRDAAVGSAGPTVLRLDRVAGATVTDVSLTVARGEIVGIAGLTGSGREVIGAMISGRLPRAGAVHAGAVEVRPGDPAAALAAGLAFVAGERSRYGTFANLTVRQNLTMGSLGRHVRRGYIDTRSERAEVSRWIDDLGIVTRGVDEPITSLSGGNQQKVLVARALRLAPAALVLDDPTSGIDVKAREGVHNIIERAAEGGTAALLISTDSDELARLADRVLILSHGRVVRQLSRGVDLSREAIDHFQVVSTPVGSVA